MRITVQHLKLGPVTQEAAEWLYLIMCTSSHAFLLNQHLTIPDFATLHPGYNCRAIIHQIPVRPELVEG